MTPTVGSLRQQSALCPSDEPVELVSDDPELHAVLKGLEVVEFYPDTTNACGGWVSTFKVKVRKKP